MAGHARQLRGRLQLAVDQVQVGTADRAGLHPQQQLTGPRHRLRQFAGNQRSGGPRLQPLQHQGEHTTLCGAPAAATSRAVAELMTLCPSTGRSPRIAGHHDTRLTAVAASPMMRALESRPMRMLHDHTSPRSHPLASMPPVCLPLYPPLPGGSCNQLTARADRPVRESAHAVAFTTDVAIRGAGSVHRRTGMQTARALPGDSGRPAIQTRRGAHHHPVWRREAGADVRRADGSIPGPHVPLVNASPPLRVAAHDSGPPWGRYNNPAGFAGAQEVHMILKEPHTRAA